MTRASFAAFRRTVEVAWPKHMESSAREHLLSVARAGNAENMRQATALLGHAPEVTGYANRPGNPVDQVAMPGPIVYRYGYLRAAIRLALQTLRDQSPVASGTYRDAHTLFIDGRPVAGLPDRIPAGAEIMIANPVPYARRLEVGRTKSGRSFVLRVPDAIYERVAKRILQPRFGAIARFTFNYVTLPGAWKVKGGLGGSYLTGETRKRGVTLKGRRYEKGGAKVRHRSQKIGEAVRAPAIFIEPPR